METIYNYLLFGFGICIGLYTYLCQKYQKGNDVKPVFEYLGHSGMLITYFNTRLLINDYCKKKKKILISAAISKFDGHLFKFNFKKKIPCFRCFMPQQPIQEVNCDVQGIFPPVAGILGSLQANEVLKTILDLKDDLNGNILIFDSLKMMLRKTKIQINPKCLNICRS